MIRKLPFLFNWTLLLELLIVLLHLMFVFLLVVDALWSLKLIALWS